MQHKPLFGKLFRIAGCGKRYETTAGMQKGLDADRTHHKENLPHRGRMIEGRTPMAVFRRGLPKEKRPVRTTPNWPLELTARGGRCQVITIDAASCRPSLGAELPSSTACFITPKLLNMASYTGPG